MNIDEIVKKRLNDATDDYNERLKFLNKKLNDLKVTKAAIGNIEVPEDTGLLDKIKNLDKKEVEITYNDGKTENGILSYANGRINVGFWMTPIFSDQEVYINKIVDKQTNEVVYDNNFKEIDNLYFQYALLYGKKPVLDFISKNEKNLESNLVEAEKRFDQAVENIRQLEGQINEMLSVGKQMIYPQLQQKWEEFVLKSAEDSINYYITKNAFEIMKALHEGKTVEQANTLIDDGHSGSSYNFMVKEILEFSKRGVEFYKGQDEYKWIQRDDKLREKTNSLIKDIEERNKNYEKQLNKENSMEL